ncbi:MAG: CAP domain-containing protein [Clostridiales bacterium]|jgi:uncharacterized protein YkwD|nr:CAP domain-containing protein [Clostridiales bacterium]
MKNSRNTFLFYRLLVALLCAAAFFGGGWGVENVHAANAAVPVAAPSAAAALPSASDVFIDGRSVPISAYNIADYNYFKLRDLAAAVDCAVWYDEQRDTVMIDTAFGYDAPPGSASPASAPPGPASAASAPVPALPSPSAVFVNGAAAHFEAYQIAGYNYFKLRDFLAAIDVGVRYDAEADAIHIDTGVGYGDAENGADFFFTEPGAVPLGPASPPDPDSGGGAGPNSGPSGLFGPSETSGRGLSSPTSPSPSPSPNPAPEAVGGASDPTMEFRLRVVQLVNAERAAVGLLPLAVDGTLFEAAQFKCLDMAEFGYFAHESPNYGSAEALLSRFNVDFSYWGENLASGQPSPETVVQAWMDSPGHKANILNEHYEYIGVGLAYSPKDGTPLWTQEFTAGPL